MNINTRKVFGVAELTRLIRNALEDSVGEVWVEGEISNLRRPASGHWYFTLKDETAQVPAVMFRNAQAQAGCELKDGIKVRLFGLVSAYEKSGHYQIIARSIEPAGAGSLQAAFEALKKKLAAEGLFDAARKKPVPLLPRMVGVVTSPTGAAIRDILTVAGRRFSNLHIVIYPARVQGDGAAAEIAEGIDFFNAEGKADVLIVGRGGGSLEDLWCFNDEIVARAVARSRIPVISAVGHETDFTICDFAADLRAPTPSAAAELVVGLKEGFQEKLSVFSRGLARAARARLMELKGRLSASSGSYAFREPGNIVRQVRERLGHIASLLGGSLQGLLREKQQTADELALRLAHALKGALHERRAGLQSLGAHLRAIGPAAVLKRGYSITFGRGGAILKSAARASPGETIFTRLAEGTLESRITKTGGATAGQE